MKVLITGGCGFIGSYICRELARRQIEIIAFDSFTQYIPPFSSGYHFYIRDRLKDINDKIIIIRGDTRNKTELDSVINKYKPSHIIHLAALPIADLAYQYPEEAVSTIIAGTVNLLQIIKEAKFVKRFVYASSSMIYGDFNSEIADEDHPKRPKDIYGGTKYAGEIMVESFGRRYGLEYSIVRPSAVYGPTDVNRRVSQIFVENALLGKKILVKGPNVKLDFTFVKDAADGIILAAFQPKGANEIFNITYGQARSLLDFVNVIKSVFPNVEYEVAEEEVFRPRRGTLSIKKAMKLLGYRPQYPLEKGLPLYIDYASKYLEYLKSKNNEYENSLFWDK